VPKVFIEFSKQSPSLRDPFLGRLFGRVRIEQVQDLGEKDLMGNEAGDDVDNLQCSLQKRGQIESVRQVRSSNRSGQVEVTYRNQLFIRQGAFFQTCVQVFDVVPKQLFDGGHL
jgi:hypothetical protein